MITIRPADASDSRPLFDWRNDPLTRAASVSTTEVPWSDHEEWFARMLASDDHLLYIAHAPDAEDPADRVGAVRFDLVSDGISADLSINLNPAYRGRGMGRSVLGAAIATFDASRDEAVALHAVIRPSNSASIRLFEAVGFVAAGEDGVLLHFWREIAPSAGAAATTRTGPS